MKPKVSILVPVYNVEKYLKQCIDSLLCQTLKEFEIIAVDDGSTDGSSKILESYKDPRLKIIHKENSGYGATMNVALKNAQGKYIGILESDDFAGEDAFASYYRIIKKHNLDVLKSNHFNYTDKRTTESNVLPDGLYDKVFTPRKDGFAPYEAATPPWNGMYRREFLLGNDIWFNETPGASFQDVGFCMKCFVTANRLMYTNKRYIYYRRDNLNASQHSKDKANAIFDELNEIYRYLDSHGKFPSLTYTSLATACYHHLTFNLYRVRYEHKEEFLNKMAKFMVYLNERGDVDISRFPEEKQEGVRSLLEDPQKFVSFLMEQFKILHDNNIEC